MCVSIGICIIHVCTMHCSVFSVVLPPHGVSLGCSKVPYHQENDAQRRNIQNRKGLAMMQTWRDTDEKLRDVGRGGNVLDTYQSGYPCNNLSSLSVATSPQGCSLACSQ